MLKKIILALSLTISILVYGQAPLSFYSDNVASIGIVACDLRTGKEIYNYDGNRSLTPASTLKVVTAAATLSKYSGDFRYETPAYARGKISGDTLYGNIEIMGSGDPTLGSLDFPENQTLINDIADAINAKGVKYVTGFINVNTGIQPNQGKVKTWEIEDGIFKYGSGWYVFNYKDNCFFLDTHTFESIPTGIPTEEIVHGSQGRVYYQVAFGCSVNDVVDEEIFPRGHKARLANPYPDVLFANELSDFLEKSGINHVTIDDCEFDMYESVYRDSILLAAHHSPALRDILQKMMYKSDNTMAEASLRLLAPGESLDAALNVEKKFLIDNGIDPGMYIILDGSGLSRGNAVSPSFLTKVLCMMADNDEYVGLFPRAGVHGTVAGFMKNSPLKGKIAIKSGYMSGVLCYAGYILDNNGKPIIAFTIMANNFVCKTSELKNSVDAFLTKLYREHI